MLYLLAFSGVRVHAHYCGKQLASIGFYTDAEPCGSCSTKKKKKKCCNDQEIHAKAKADHQAPVVKGLQFSALFILPDPLQLYASLVPPAGTALTKGCAHQANAPPGRWQDLPLYKLHQRFTYYG
jgi:hypothetical protein